MKERTVKKPQLDTSQALAFATGTIKNENIGKDTSQQKKMLKKAIIDGGNRVFFAPEGDKRLTINIRDDLHKKLKIAAIEQGSTAGDIIEHLIDKYL